MVVPWPPRNLVAECTTMSAPCAMGWQRYGEAAVLSTMKGTFASRAIAAIAAMSITLMAGLPRVSEKIALVLGFNALRKFSGSSGSTSVESMPSFLKFTLSMVFVPPYTLAEETTWSPLSRMLRNATISAACPEAVATAARPFSIAATRSSKTAVVGFDRRV